MNIPPSINKSENCLENYLSIRSQNRPTHMYKLCGEHQSKKFITNYNDVLINLVTGSLNGLTVGFNLVYSVIGAATGGKLIINEN